MRKFFNFIFKYSCWNPLKTKDVNIYIPTCEVRYAHFEGGWLQRKIKKIMLSTHFQKQGYAVSTLWDGDRFLAVRPHAPLSGPYTLVDLVYFKGLCTFFPKFSRDWVIFAYRPTESTWALCVFKNAYLYYKRTVPLGNTVANLIAYTEETLLYMEKYGATLNNTSLIYLSETELSLAHPIFPVKRIAGRLEDLEEACQNERPFTFSPPLNGARVWMAYYAQQGFLKGILPCILFTWITLGIGSYIYRGEGHIPLKKEVGELEKINLPKKIMEGMKSAQKNEVQWLHAVKDALPQDQHPKSIIMHNAKGEITLSYNTPPTIHHKSNMEKSVNTIRIKRQGNTLVIMEKVL